VKRLVSIWLAIAAVVAAATGMSASGADFVPASSSPANAFGAAADFNTVAVSMDDPGTPRRGVVSLSGTASSERGIDRVRFETSPAGAGTWTDACEDTSAPYACDWDSAGVADGLRDVRATAVDQAGYQRTSTVLARLFDNALPVASLSDPGVVRGTEILTATGSDVLSGLAWLSIAHRPVGGSWTTLCSGLTSPQVCALDSTTLADGAHELRARATDAVGNEHDFVYTRTVDNNAPTASIPALGPVKGTIAVPVTTGDGAGSGVNQVTIQIRQGVGAWANLCAVDTAAPWECSSFDTLTRTDGLYDLQAIVEDNAGFITTSAVTTFRIDNAVPATSTLTNPGTPLSGSVTLSGTATDTGSGIASWKPQYRLVGNTTWLDGCTDTTVTAPSNYSCAWATAAVADGMYELRALATDAAGNQFGSTTITNRRVDNVAPTVSLTDPGTPLTGTVTLNATASDGGGIANVTFQRSPAGAGTWTNICAADTAAPYTCSFNTTAVADAFYDIRAVATDNFPRTASSVVTSRFVENVAPFGVDVQTTSGGAIAGRPDAGDTISLTWSEPIAPASVLAGWDGSATAITVRLTNSANNDRMDFYNAANTTRLNLVRTATDLRLARNYVSGAVVLNGTMVRNGNTITVTLGTVVSGGASLATSTATGAIRWRPSASALDVSGKASSTTTVTESGTADSDF
jgi:chitinase